MAPQRSRTWYRTIPLLVALPGLALIAQGNAAAERPPTPKHIPYVAHTINSPDPSTNGRWAERTVTAGDLNHDGVNDVWVGVPKAMVDGQQIGRVYALDGAALGRGQRKILYTIDSPRPQVGKNFGFYIASLGDVNHDGVSDIAVGTDAEDVGTHQNQGEAWVFSGRDGHLLYALNDPFPQGSPTHDVRFGSRLTRAGDVNGDGIPDILVGAPQNDVPAGCTDNVSFGEALPPGCRREQGQAFVFSGRDGTLLRTLNMPSADLYPSPGAITPGTCQQLCGHFGGSVSGPGDTNGDGVPDLVVSAAVAQVDGNPGQGRMYLFSGANGTLLRRIDDPVPQPFAFFGFQDTAPLSPGDVDHDGSADIFGSGFEQRGPTGVVGQGRAWVFDGRTGTVLYELANPHPQFGGKFGWSLAREQTYYNSSGRPGLTSADPPLYVGNDPHTHFGSDQRGETNLFRPETGAWIRTLPLPAPWNAEHGTGNISTSPPSGDLGPNLGWTVSAPGDLNRDHRPDYLAGAPFTDVGSIVNEGVLIDFLSLTRRDCKGYRDITTTDGQTFINHGQCVSAVARAGSWRRGGGWDVGPRRAR